MSFTTVGNYTTSEITKFQLYYTTTASFLSPILLSTINSPNGAGPQTFPTFSVNTGNNSTIYFWITVDVASSSVTDGHTIAVNATVATNVTANATPTGSGAASGTQTLKGTPTATAGGSQTICQNGTATVSGASSTNGTILWTHSGAGFLANATTLAPTYTAAAGDAGNTVTLTMTVSNNPCTAATATYSVIIKAAPTASAGGSQTICQNGTATVSGASSTNGTILWTHSGAGFLANATTLAPTYTAAAGDAGNTVTLTMTVSNNPCTAATATYSVIIKAAPTASAGGSQTICQNGTATVSGASSTNGTILWTHSGAGSLANVTTLAPTYSAAAGDAGTTVILTMTVSNNPCSDATATYAVTVNPLLTAPTITASGLTTFCEGGSVTLNSSAGSSYLWSNGATTQSINVSTSGSYTVQVTNASGCQSAASVATVVTVNALPTITVTSNTSICTGNSTTLTAGGGTSYSWSPSTGLNSTTGSSVTANPTTTTTYTVIGTDGNGCTNSAQVTVTVNPVPTAPTITASGPTTFCNGGSVTLTSSSGSSYLWSTGATTASINVTTSGSYWVKVTDSNGCQSAASTATTVTVNALPTATLFSSDADNTFCAGISVTFTAGAGTNYNFRVAGTSVQTGASNTYTTSALTDGQVVDVIVTNATGCTANSAGITNSVNALPTVNAGSTMTAICQGGTSAALGGSVGGSATGGTWSDGAVVGTFIPNATTLNATWTPPASYTGTAILTLITSGGSCGTTFATKDIVVNPNMTASVSIVASATTICAGTSVTFTATPTNGGAAPTYQWKKNGSIVGSNSSTYIDAALANGDQITCALTSNATCSTGSPATSNTITMTVNPDLPASIIIGATATTICAGTSVTFTATPTNGGAAPTYQWKKNGSIVGSNSSTYIDAALANGDQITCALTSNATCSTGSPATSNTVTMTVNPNLPASVSIAASATTICSGTSVTFTAAPTNEGSAPTYQWYNGASPISGATNPTYTSTTLANGATILVQMTSNANCASGNPATSNTVVMTVNPNLPASVSIAASATTICSGTSVTFTATPTNGGSMPSYQWKKNGTDISGATNVTYTYAPANGDIITCVLISNATCATGNPATSNTVTMTVNPNLPASVSIAASATTICSGTSVTFTAAPTNEGSAPTYQWYNGTSPISGATNPTYTSTTLANGATILVQMTSNANCASGNPATSNTVVMTVNPNLPASVSIAASATTICSGTSVTFTATPTNGGSMPSYQWKKNGTDISGATNVTYTYAPANGDQITCVLTSNATCATGNPATSNMITMTVNPTPSVTTANTAVTCSGSSPVISLTASVASSFSWTIGTVTGGITGASAGSGTSIGQILTNPIHTAAGTVQYLVTPTSTAGSCGGSAYTITVTVNPIPAIGSFN